jgi:peptidoglycan/LPS O-acetylase OafA/YrhL
VTTANKLIIGPETLRQPKLAGIQSLRGIAALMVVFCHLEAFQAYYFPRESHLPAWMIVGESGVDLFFVISGFIIMYVTLHPLQSWRHQAAFLIRRFGRIYPVYWAVAIPLILASLFFHGAHHKPDDSRLDPLSALFLIPRHSEPFLAVAWTLTYELYFYLVASLFFRWNGRLRLYLLMVWFILLVCVGVFHPSPFSNPFAVICFSPFCLEFIAGAMLAYGLSRGFMTVNRWFALILMVAIIIMAFVTGARHGMYGNDAAGHLYCYGIPAFVVVWMVTQMELQGSWLWIKRISPMGDRSYSIYLLHLPFITVVFQLSSMCFHEAGAVVSFLTVLIALLGLALPVEIYYRWIEKTSHALARRFAIYVEARRP